MRIVLVIIAALQIFISPCPERQDDQIPTGKELMPGEELTYIVSFSFIKIGEIKIKIKDKKIIKGIPYYSTIAYIDSYDDVPFVNLHQIYESSVSKNLYSNYFRGVVKYEDYSSYTVYDFDYHKAHISVKKGQVYPPVVWTDSIARADTVYQDGLSIFYYARLGFGSERTVYVPCFVNEEKVYTKISFSSKNEGISIDAVDYDIDCVKINGETDFVSIFGLTGLFEGWFTNDEASVPVIAKMKVLIGNITLELKEWKREGWTPPRFKG